MAGGGCVLADRALGRRVALETLEAPAAVECESGRHGGDPGRIYVFGHSSGGAHVATWAFDRTAIPERTKSVAGAILASARARADVLPDNANADAVRACFGDDSSLYEVRSPVTHVTDVELPLFNVVAEYENPYLDVYGAELLHRLSRARKRAPRFMRLTRHNHISLVRTSTPRRRSSAARSWTSSRWESRRRPSAARRSRQTVALEAAASASLVSSSTGS